LTLPFGRFSNSSACLPNSSSLDCIAEYSPQTNLIKPVQSTDSKVNNNK
jgi:hypothetical protein